MVDKFTYGDPVRLFPTVKSDEDRATSVFLATMDLVYPFRAALMKSVGRRMSKRGQDFAVHVHPKFGGKYSNKDIPDGLIAHDSKVPWKAAIEVKIKGADLDQDQLERYLKRVNENKLDALITISNEMCANPERPPLRLMSSDKRLRAIPYFHWSWTYISHVCDGLLQDDKVEDDTQRKVLSEFSVFLQDGRSGVAGFTKMNTGWIDFVNDLKARGNPSQQSYEDAVSDWHQESAELGIIISREFQRPVALLIDKTVRSSAEKRLQADVKHLRATGDLTARYDIDGIVYPLEVTLEVDQRCLRIALCHNLTDRVVTPHKRIEHFLKDLQGPKAAEKSGKHDHVHIFAKWPRYSEMTNTTLFDAIQRYNDDELKGSKLIKDGVDKIQHVELRYTPAGIAKDIVNTKRIIATLEREVVFFCQHYVDI